MPRYIDADAILKDMCAWCTNFENDMPVCKEKECAYTLLVKSAPTADVQEVKHGHWIEQADGTHFCSNCGRDALYEVMTCNAIEVSFKEKQTDICPHCGATMYGSETK